MAISTVKSTDVSVHAVKAEGESNGIVTLGTDEGERPSSHPGRYCPKKKKDILI